ncbi:MAG TPA: S9 family peptidase [Blastocatellia bacterium]|nr:S9 family peptidase [Blastocatellia bacterium]
MSESQARPYGSWKSPITSDVIVAGVVRLSEPTPSGSDTFWVESRPSEQGRNVLVRRTPDGRVADVTPAPFNVRTTVHEYGGGAFIIDRSRVYFSNYSDQKLYVQEIGSEPKPLTHSEHMRYADGVIDRRNNRIICVREDHTTSDTNAMNTLAGVDLETGDEAVLVSGNDFYSSPRLSPDGGRLAWLTWDHPNMPWDGSELWVAEVKEDGSLGHRERVAGGPDESIAQPEWSPEGDLCFISDRTGWWNIYEMRGGKTEPVCEKDSEFARPQWVFRMSSYTVQAGRIICVFNERGRWQVAKIDRETRRLERVETPYTEIAYVQAEGDRVVFLGGAPSESAVIAQLDLSARRVEALRQSSSIKIDAEYLSVPEAIEFPTENGLTAHAFYYAPANPGFAAPEGERPPLLVISHGGPTSSASTTLEPMIQYWTSRGIAVLDVNYGGSSGYGREYRRRLNGNWGVVDVDDCINGARYLVERGLADRDRLIIRGGSAGGYTTLAALTFHDFFKAGASYYGISDLEALEVDSHKFEARYNNSLIGPYPEQRDLYRARSPIHFTERLSCPLIIFQGLEDKVVPPNQAEKMFEAVRAKGLPVAYVPFEGEQHGFRKAENIKRALDGELYFYSRVFGFEADVEPDEYVTSRMLNFPD